VKALIYSSLLISHSLISPSPSPVGSTENVVRVKSEKIKLDPGCTGRTDWPHISKHVPGTVNVTSQILCKGHFVILKVTLIRINLSGALTKVANSSGRDKVTLNVSIPCTWRKGDKPFWYVVLANYSVDNGAHNYAQLQSEIKC
jgi:hypothetical protein